LSSLVFIVVLRAVVLSDGRRTMARLAVGRL